MASLYLLVMMGHVPLYLNSSLSYISSYSLRPSPLTLKPSDLILNTTSILFFFYSLSSSKALSSWQVRCLLAILDTSLGYNLLFCKDSQSSLSPWYPLYLYYSVTWFFTYSPLFTFLTSSFSYTLPLS
jgi:hypothetical protein